MWFLKDSKVKERTIQKLVEQKTLDVLNDIAMKQFENVFDGCLDFTVNLLFRKLLKKKMSLDVFWQKIDEHYKKFKKNFVLPTFLDNHDMDRFIFLAKNRENLVAFFSSLQFSLPQPPIIYYGNEIGLSQKKRIVFNKEFSDLEARRFMTWEKVKDNPLLQHYKNLVLGRRFLKRR